MTSAALVGSTGLVGSHILQILSKHNGISEVYAFARKELPESGSVKSLVNKDSASWPSMFPGSVPLFLSALGTTKANAGSLENQRKIDYDLNLTMAKAAKENGAKAYVLVSSSGANSTSMIPYSKMKGELEDAVKALGFEHTIIVRPGLIVGDRVESRPAEMVVRKIAGALGSIGGGILTNSWAQDADVIAKAAIKAGMDALDGKQSEKVRMVSQAEIVKLGETEWKE